MSVHHFSIKHCSWVLILRVNTPNSGLVLIHPIDLVVVKAFGLFETDKGKKHINRPPVIEKMCNVVAVL